MAFKKRDIETMIAEVLAQRPDADDNDPENVVWGITFRFLEEIHDMLRLLVAASGLPVEENE